MCAMSRRIFHFNLNVSIRQIWGDKKFLFFIDEKEEWESPPSILVARNPNWSQRSGTRTNYIKRRYYYLKYTLPKISCIVWLSDKKLMCYYISNCWFSEHIGNMIISKAINWRWSSLILSNLWESIFTWAWKNRLIDK
jgi:hypothetical protein